MNPEIERIQRVRANAIKRRDWYRERIENPINKETGQPLSRKTVVQYRSKINGCTRLIDLCEQEIQALVVYSSPRED